MPIALVTGVSSGIGRATALELARRGFEIIAAGRSAGRTQPVVDQIRADGRPAEFLELDLASLASVKMAAARFGDSGRRLDVLINNAGVGVNRRKRTEDGFEPHFGINHLGHFLLTDRLMPTFGPEARVVSLASAVHFRARGIDFDKVRRAPGLTGYHEYAVSKLANILFIRELAHRRDDLRAFAVHPGLVKTPLIPTLARPLLAGRMLSPEQGADTVVWCATSDQPLGRSGGYFQRREPTVPSVQAQDDDLARELWERSEAWCR